MANNVAKWNARKHWNSSKVIDNKISNFKSNHSPVEWNLFNNRIKNSKQHLTVGNKNTTCPSLNKITS